jgi:hypothetical protein
MKNYKLLIPLLLLLCTPITSCDENGNLVLPGLSNEEIVQGLKSALVVGTDTSVTRLNRLNGYFGNAALKILLPPEAAQVVSNINRIPGGQALLDEVVLKMNRGAEQAAVKARPIFVDAITNMTFTDARNILFAKDSLGRRNDTAATNYLRRTTYNGLYSAFQPELRSSLESVGAVTAWNTLFTNWNNFANSFIGQSLNLNPVNPNLDEYATNRALHGLFIQVRAQEDAIRNNPAERVNDILKKVFGELDKQ